MILLDTENKRSSICSLSSVGLAVFSRSIFHTFSSLEHTQGKKGGGTEFTITDIISFMLRMSLY